MNCKQNWQETESKALHNIGIDVAQNLPGNPSFNLGYITPEFLPMFDAPLALGRHLSQAEGLDSQVPVTVLSYQVWQQHFAGDPAVLGKTLQFRGVSFTVVGVLAAHFVEPVLAAPGWSTDLWLSYDFNDVGTPNWSFNSNQIHLLLKLKADANPQQLAHSFEQWAAPEFAAATGAVAVDPQREYDSGSNEQWCELVTYTEKDGLYVNLEGRVQRSEGAVFPPGEAREDWILARDAAERAEVRRLLAWFDRRFTDEVNAVLLHERMEKPLLRLGPPEARALRAGLPVTPSFGP